MRNKLSIGAIAIIFLLFTYAAMTAPQQPEGANVSALLEAKKQATATFFDSAIPVTERLEAANRMGYPQDETFEKLLEVGRKTTEKDQVRLVALKRYRFDQQYIDTVFDIIANPDESGLLASELIYDIGRRTTFRQPAEIRQALQGALRQRLEDDRKPVRLAAYQILVASHDAVAIDRLVEGVRNNDPPIPMPEAIELLDIDGPTRHVNTVRSLIDATDPAVLAPVARVLAVDPDSRPTVVELAKDPESSTEVRLNALRALSREDEEYFSYALRLMSNRQENPDVRYAAIEGAMSRLNYHNVPGEQQIQFAQAVSGIAGQASGQVTSDGKDLGVEAKKLFAHLRRHFPAVKKHFAKR